MEIKNIEEVEALGNKDLIVFDLDGTLAESKTVMDLEMTDLLTKLLAKKKVAVIGGGKYELFQSQLMSQLEGLSEDLLKNLFLFPTTATTFYHYEEGEWKNVYYLGLTEEERAQIKETFEKVFEEIDYQHPKKVYGSVVEDRGTQVTFSALGQEIVSELGKEGVVQKEQWKHDHNEVKMKIAERMQHYLPDLEVRAAGTTSVDITKKGIDKAYGLKQIEEHLNIPISNMFFAGDAIFPGGNDFAVTTTDVDYMKVKTPEETKAAIKVFIEQ